MMHGPRAAATSDGSLEAMNEYRTVFATPSDSSLKNRARERRADAATVRNRPEWSTLEADSAPVSESSLIQSSFRIPQL
jgi:hypothetical protein